MDAAMRRAATVAAVAFMVVAAEPYAAHQSPAPRAASSALDRFDLSASGAVRRALPGNLREVSGLASDSDGRLFGHADERGIVSQIDPCEGIVKPAFSLGFPPVQADFEGMAVADGRFFLVTSTGQLYETRGGVSGAAAPFTVVNTGFGNQCEVEGLTWDPAGRLLVAGCKEPRAGRPRGTVTFLRWSVDEKAPATPIVLRLSAGSMTRKFRPSAVEFDGMTGHYIAVAGPERQLLEFTASGVVVAVRPLDRQVHQQPEGVALMGDSLLVIADEGGGRRGTLTCYRPKR